MVKTFRNVVGVPLMVTVLIEATVLDGGDVVTLSADLDAVCPLANVEEQSKAKLAFRKLARAMVPQSLRTETN
jgi:hypothetical protein